MSRQGPDSNSLPEPFVVNPTSTHTHTFILLHGLGSNGEKFGRELLETGVTSRGSTLKQIFPYAKFIFPTSRRRRSSAFGRSMLTQWFDIARLPDPAYRKELQLQGLAESTQDILEILRYEMDINKIPPCNIFLGGLSQGCAMSLSILLALDHDVGGFIGMSGYLPYREDIDEAVTDVIVDDDDPFSTETSADDCEDPCVRATVFERDLLCLPPLVRCGPENTAHSTPIFLGHGEEDEKVPCSLGQAMAATLKKAGYPVQLKIYSGLGHWYKIPEEIDDIVGFIESTMG
ncbi:hypothetical protein VTK73DRAFT_2955 [Phialemonium thermophilum]|uniref:Phospholipase/carboxylesterase/thioesterase domain-containing protein n=1 Tax=Phialemonium thermophilum TaxID=223376 RepID=A0ABR3X1N4_9PEZI